MVVRRHRGRDPGQEYPVEANSVWGASHLWSLDRVRHTSLPEDALEVVDNLGVLSQIRLVVHHEVLNVWERNPGAARVEDGIDQSPVTLVVGSEKF